MSFLIHSPNVGTLLSEDCGSLLKGLPFGLPLGISLHLSINTVLPKVTSDLLSANPLGPLSVLMFLDTHGTISLGLCLK